MLFWQILSYAAVWAAVLSVLWVLTSYYHNSKKKKAKSYTAYCKILLEGGGYEFDTFQLSAKDVISASTAVATVAREEYPEMSSLIVFEVKPDKWGQQ